MVSVMLFWASVSRRGADVARLTGRSDRGPRAPSTPLSHAPDLQYLSSPHHQLVEPPLGGVDDLRVHCLDQLIDRRVLDEIEHPILMLVPQALQHGEGLSRPAR